MFRCKLTPSFCNNWPEISVVANGKELWHQFVNKEQIVEINFELEDYNQIEIVYLNKRIGPDVWDTKIDQEGKIIEDQHCILSDIYIAGSRCDFILGSMPYMCDSGITLDNIHGFMSQKGKFQILFPKDVYLWIIENRNRLLAGTFIKKGESALAYFESYASNTTTKTYELLEKVDMLLEELSQSNFK